MSASSPSWSLYIVLNVALRRNPELREIAGAARAVRHRRLRPGDPLLDRGRAQHAAARLAGLLLCNRLLWLGVSVARSSALAYGAFRFADKGISKRKLREAGAGRSSRRRARRAAGAAGPLPGPPRPARTAWAQLRARTRFEMRQVFKSPAFFVLLALGLFNCGRRPAGSATSCYGTPIHPVTRVADRRCCAGSFTFIPLIIAIYYAGELVWRERDRKMHEIIDATPLPDWAFVVPKTLAVAPGAARHPADQRRSPPCSSSCSRAITDFELGKYLLWYVAADGARHDPARGPGGVRPGAQPQQISSAGA